MTINLKVKTTLNGQEFEIMAQDILDDPEEIKSVKQYLVNAAVFGVHDVCEKMNKFDNAQSDTKPSSIKNVVKSRTVSRPKPAEKYDEPATPKQIDRLIQLGYAYDENEFLSKAKASTLIKVMLASIENGN